MGWLLDRASEPSTWQGIAALATVAGVQLAPEIQHNVISVGISIFGLINIIKKDR